MTCKDLKRLTISDVHKAKSNTERLMNFAYAKDNRVFIPQQYKEDIYLCEYVAKHGCGLTAESVMEGSCFECDLDCVPGILYFCAVQAAELRERLKMFEDKLENGALIELPCKVGDTVYHYCKEICAILPYFIERIVIDYDVENRNGYWTFECMCSEDDELIDAIDFTTDEIGKTVFLSKSEAEQKLKELQND